VDSFPSFITLKRNKNTAGGSLPCRAREKDDGMAE